MDSLVEGAGFEPSVPLRNRGTLQLYSELFDRMIATHYGRLVKTIGDGFSSSSAVVEALTLCERGAGLHGRARYSRSGRREPRHVL